MSKQINDYLHLYHPQGGLEVMLKDGRKGIFHGVTNSMMCKIFVDGGYIDEYANNIKPILRPLSDTSNEEKKEYQKILIYTPMNTEQDVIKIRANETTYLLSKHFDLFGLIEAGLAIDATKIKN